MALVTKIRFPHTMGLEWPRPGMGVFHRTFFPFSTSHAVGVAYPSAIPLALGPRKEGQFALARTPSLAARDGEANSRASTGARIASLRFMSLSPPRWVVESR